MEQWLTEIFGKEALTPLYAVERAQSSFSTTTTWESTATTPGKVTKLQGEIITRLARERRNIQFNGTRIFLYTNIFEKL